MKKLEYIVALVGFYQIENSFSGASEVSNSVFDSIKSKRKKIFQIKNYNFKFKNEYLNYIFFSFILKPIRIVFLILKLIFFFRETKKRLVIIEGCSWIGFSYILILILKICFREILIIYHAHNIEYEIRKQKNNKLIQYFTKIFEKKVYELSNYATVVSKVDQVKIKKLYNVESIIFKNGISKKRLKVKRIRNFRLKNFIIFSGNFFYRPNEIAIKKLLIEILPKINKKFPEIKLILTGTDFPKYIFDYKNVVIKKKLEKSKLNYLIKNSLCSILPLTNSPGTKLKIIESLMLGNPIISTKFAFKGIDIKSKNPPFILKKNSNIIELLNNLIKKNKIYKNKSLRDSNKYYKKEYTMENIINNFFEKDVKLID